MSSKKAHEEALDGGHIVTPGGARSIRERAAATRAKGVVADAKSEDKLAYKERKSVIMNTRMTPGFHDALRVYADILRRENHRVTSVSSLVRQLAHRPMANRLKRVLSAIDLLGKIEKTRRGEVVLDDDGKIVSYETLRKSLDAIGKYNRSDLDRLRKDAKALGGYTIEGLI